MRKLIAALCLAMAAAPALAQNQTATIAPTDARAHVGRTVTVEGAVSDVHTGRSGATFIDVGGRFPDSPFTAVIFASDRAQFPGAAALEGKTVDVNGAVQLYQGRPEIILKTADQLRAR
jgi:DNA/RNA endonuclease YhcR with UshA esterase domain